MKKHILVLLMAVVCLVSFAACGKKDTPYSLYEGAVTALDEATGYEAKMTMKMSMEIDGETETEEMEMSMKINGNDLQVEMDEQDILYVGGAMYMDMGELGKYKIEMTPEELTENMGFDMSYADVPALTEDDFKDIELVEDGDNRTFTMALDEDTVKEWMGDSLDQYMQEGMEIAFSNMSFSATFDEDDTLLEMTIKMTMDYDMGEFGEMSMDMEMNIEFISLEAPSITAPSDAADYVEMDADDMFGF